MAPPDPWWRIPDDELPGKLWDHMQAQQEWRKVWLAAATELQHRYEVETDRFDEAVWASISSSLRWNADTPPPCLNVVRAGIDTAASKLLANLPAVSVKPYNVPPEYEPEAQEMTDALNGVLNTDEAMDELGNVVLSGLIEGVAWAWPCVADEGRVEYQQLQQYQVFYDWEDARHGRPRSLHVWLTVSRSELIAKWEAMAGADMPEGTTVPAGALEAIKGCPEAEHGDMMGKDAWGSVYELRMSRYTGDLLTSFSSDKLHVLHSWHLPGGPKAKDGLHTITIHPGGKGGQGTGRPDTNGGAVLLRERYDLPRFPVVRLACFPHREGLGALGLGHLLVGAQAELDRLIDRITTVSQEAGDTIILIDEQWEMDKEDIAGEEGNHGTRFVKLKTGGQLQAPMAVPLTGINPQDLELVDRYTGQWSLGLVGISIALSQAQSEFNGAVSGIAQVQEQERQADRLVIIERNIGRFVRELAQGTMDVIETETEINPDFAMVWQDGERRPRKTKYSDIRIPHQDWSITLEETGLFGNSRAARIQSMLEMGDRQQLPPDLVQAELLRSADLRRTASHVTAPERLVEHHIALLVDTRQQEPRPDVHTPLELARARALAAWQDRAAKGAEESEKGRTILRRIERYIAAVQRKVDEMVAAAAPPPAPGGPGFMSATIGDPGMSPEINAIAPTGAASGMADVSAAAPGVIG